MHILFNCSSLPLLQIFLSVFLTTVFTRVEGRKSAIVFPPFFSPSWRSSRANIGVIIYILYIIIMVVPWFGKLDSSHVFFNCPTREVLAGIRAERSFMMLRETDGFSSMSFNKSLISSSRASFEAFVFLVRS